MHDDEHPWPDSADSPPSHGERDPAAANGDLHAWRRALGPGGIHARIERIAVDERVALEDRVFDRMRAKAVLLDADRLAIGAAARLVHHADEYDGTTPLDPWIDARVDAAIEDQLNEDAIAERDDLPVKADDPRYARLAGALGTDARSFRRGAVVFHDLPLEERTAFWAVFAEGRTIESHALRARVSVQIARARLERAVTTFCTLGRHRGPDDPPPARHRRPSR